MTNTDNTGRCQTLKQRTRYTVSAFTPHQIVIRQWEEKWRHCNFRLWSNLLKSSDGDAHKSIQIILIKVSNVFAGQFLEKRKSW